MMRRAHAAMITDPDERAGCQVSGAGCRVSGGGWRVPGVWPGAGCRVPGAVPGAASGVMSGVGCQVLAGCRVSGASVGRRVPGVGRWVRVAAPGAGCRVPGAVSVLVPGVGCRNAPRGCPSSTSDSWSPLFFDRPYCGGDTRRCLSPTLATIGVTAKTSQRYGISGRSTSSRLISSSGAPARPSRVAVSPRSKAVTTPPLLINSARSTTWSNSRTLPGHK